MTRTVADQDSGRKSPRSNDAQAIAMLGVVLLSWHAVVMLLRPFRWLAEQGARLMPSGMRQNKPSELGNPVLGSPVVSSPVVSSAVVSKIRDDHR